MAGRCGTDIFVLLTGYFLVKSAGVKYNRLFSLWLRLFFYSVVLYLLFVVTGLEAFGVKTLLDAMRPVTKVQWWFVSTYFVLYLLHPHINILLNAMSREEYKKFLMAVFFYWSIVPTLTNSNFGASAITNFICLYSLAGYVRLWADDFGSKKYILLGIFFFAVNCLSVVVLDLLGLKFTYFAKKSVYFCEQMKPFTVLSALCMLIGFKKLNIKHNALINKIASATIGVYLIHDHNLVRPFLWHAVFRNASFQDSPYLIPYSIIVVLCVYFVCTLIELARKKLFALCRAEALGEKLAAIIERSGLRKTVHRILKC